MIDIQTISIVLAALSFILAATYYILNIQNQRETRQAQLFMNIYNNHTSFQNITILNEILQWEWEDLDDFFDKYWIPKNTEAFNKWSYYFSTLEGLGILIKDKMLDPELIYSSQWASIILLWEKFLPVVEAVRVRGNMPHAYEDPEFLYDEMIRLRDKKGHLPVQSYSSVPNNR